MQPGHTIQMRTAAALCAASLTVLLGAASCQPQGPAAPEATGQAAEGALESGADGPDASAPATEAPAYVEAPFSSIPADAVLTVDELADWTATRADFAIVDVRRRNPYQASHIEGALSIPAGTELAVRIDEVPRNQTVILVDQKGDTVAGVRQQLIDAGWDGTLLFALEGGETAWESADNPIVHTKGSAC